MDDEMEPLTGRQASGMLDFLIERREQYQKRQQGPGADLAEGVGPDEARFARLDQILRDGGGMSPLDDAMSDLGIGLCRHSPTEGATHWTVEIGGDAVGVIVPFGVSVLRSQPTREGEDDGRP